MHFNRKDLKERHKYLAPGATVRENHDSCPSGVDRRRRLYVTKSPDNRKLRIYCHNCGQGTVVDMHTIALRPVVAPVPEGPVELPKEIWAGPGAIHPKHKLWLRSYGILDQALERDVYSMSDMELVFPYTHDCKLTGYQVRYFDGRKPKWKNKGDPIAWYGAQKAKKNTIITEDIVSAMKWRAATEGGYISLGGHRPYLDPMYYIGLGNFIVWLDNDKPSVIEAAEDLAYQLKAVLVTGGTDPKRYTKEELKRVNDECDKLRATAPPDDGSTHVFKVWAPGEGVRP